MVELSKQAMVVAVVYVLSLLVGLVASISAKKFSFATVLSFLMGLGFAALVTYDTACLTAGNCGTWSWVRTFLYVLFPAIGVVAAIFALFSGKGLKAPATPPMPGMGPMPKMPSEEEY